jgi:hypothetical protein
MRKLLNCYFNLIACNPKIASDKQRQNTMVKTQGNP